MLATKSPLDGLSPSQLTLIETLKKYPQARVKLHTSLESETWRDPPWTWRQSGHQTAQIELLRDDQFLYDSDLSAKAAGSPYTRHDRLGRSAGALVKRGLLVEVAVEREPGPPTKEDRYASRNAYYGLAESVDRAGTANARREQAAKAQAALDRESAWQAAKKPIDARARKVHEAQSAVIRKLRPALDALSDKELLALWGQWQSLSGSLFTVNMELRALAKVHHRKAEIYENAKY